MAIFPGPGRAAAAEGVEGGGRSRFALLSACRPRLLEEKLPNDGNLYRTDF